MLRRIVSIRLFLIIVCLFLCNIDLSYASVICQDDFSSYTAGVISGTKNCPNGTGSWTIDNIWNTASIVSGAGPDGSKAAKITFNVNELNRWFSWQPAGNMQEIWIKFSFKVDCGSGSCAGGAKFLKLFGTDAYTERASLGTFQLGWEGGFYGILFGCRETLRDAQSLLNYDGSKSLESGCPNPSYTGAGQNIDPRDNIWHTFKVHARYNDNGLNNGFYQVWYDGTLSASYTGINNRSDGADKYVGEVGLGGWNQSYGGTPYYIYYDNFVVADSDPDSGADVTPPTVTGFVIPATSSSLTVPVTTLTATDAVGVTGYCVNESATAPTSASCSGSGWAGSAQTQYVFATDGSKTIYAWAKDAAGNISTSLNDSVTITLPIAGATVLGGSILAGGSQ